MAVTAALVALSASSVVNVEWRSSTGTSTAGFMSSLPPHLKLVSNGSRIRMSADGRKEFKSFATPAALAVLAAAVIPDMADAVSPGVSPSLKSLLLSVVAGGVVFVAIGGAVAAVSTFDPVKRG